MTQNPEILTDEEIDRWDFAKWESELHLIFASESKLGRTIDEQLSRLETLLSFGEKAKATIRALKAEVAELKKENADLWEENSAVLDVLAQRDFEDDPDPDKYLKQRHEAKRRGA